MPLNKSIKLRITNKMKLLKFQQLNMQIGVIKNFIM